ncbi:MAG: hypothetical protein LBG72_08145 [Spirochaetaceae bacterium]|jgi:class 3 adenylate cyclase|nr:hypothetical protein [Spirochaetaceae bacterium]
MKASKTKTHSLDGKIIFPLFWKLALFTALSFAAACAAAFFSINASLAPDAEFKAKVYAETLNQNTALIAGNFLGGTKNAAESFANMLIARSMADASYLNSGEHYFLVNSFFRTNPHIAGIIIHKNGTPFPTRADAPSVFNTSLINDRKFDYKDFSTFLTANEASIRAALNMARDGAVLSARTPFNCPMLMYALPQNGETGIYCFFLADSLNAVFEEKANTDGKAADGAGGMALVSITGAVLAASGHNAPALISGEILTPVFLQTLRQARMRGGNSGTFIFSSPGSKYRIFYNESSLTAKNTAQTALFFTDWFSAYDTAVVSYFPADAAVRDMRVLFIRSALLALAVLISALIVLRLFSQTSLAALARLSKAAEDAQAGNFGMELKRAPRDEIGRLAARWTQLSETLKVYVAFGSAALARAFVHNEIPEGITKKNAVILYAYIVNFLELKQKLGMREFSRYISRFISVVNDKSSRTKGIAGDFSGGMILCHWGAAFSTGSKNHDTLNAVRSALMMRVAFIDDNRERIEKNMPPVYVSFTLDAGVVCAGLAGNSTRREYIIFGGPARSAKSTALVNRFQTADIIASERIFLRVNKFILSREIERHIYAVINLKTEEGVTQPVPRTLEELRALIKFDNEKTDAPL